MLPPCESLKSGVDGKSSDIRLDHTHIRTHLSVCWLTSRAASRYSQERRLCCRARFDAALWVRHRRCSLRFVNSGDFDEALEALVDDTAAWLRRPAQALMPQWTHSLSATQHINSLTRSRTTQLVNKKHSTTYAVQLVQQPRQELDTLVLRAHVEALLAAHRHLLDELVGADLRSTQRYT